MRIGDHRSSMERSLTQRGVLRLLVLACLAPSLAGCTLSWTVGPADASDGDGPAASGPDSRADTTTTEGCQGLLDGVGLDRAQVLACQMTCPDTVQDQCGCEVPVENAQSQTVQSYVMAVAQYNAAGCHDPNCSFACPSVIHQCVRGSTSAGICA